MAPEQAANIALREEKHYVDTTVAEAVSAGGGPTTARRTQYTEKLMPTRPSILRAENKGYRIKKKIDKFKFSETQARGLTQISAADAT